jgi:hypothetical protein
LTQPVVSSAQAAAGEVLASWIRFRP